jgi:hypothetical protein
LSKLDDLSSLCQQIEVVQENTNSASEIKEEFYSERLSQRVDKGSNTTLVEQYTTETRRIGIDPQPVVKKRNVDTANSRKEKENSLPKRKPYSKERKRESSKSVPKPVKKKQKDVKSISPMPSTQATKVKKPDIITQLTSPVLG